MTLDPRAQLALVVAAAVLALFGGPAGALAVLAASMVVVARLGATARVGRALVSVAPLVLAILLIDVLIARSGPLPALRIVTLVALATAFAAAADADALIAALRWARVPFDVAFALVVGGRLVPFAAADLADLMDAARLRGLPIDGDPLQRLRAWARLSVPLLVVTIRRGLRLGEAMDTRGFDPARPRVVRTALRWSRRDTIALAVGAVALAAAILLAR